MARLSPIALVTSCNSNPTAPTPVLQTETFTGTLQPLGVDVKTFAVVYSQSSTDLSVIINSLTTVAGSTPVTGITIGIGFGSRSGSTCSLQVQTPVATLGQDDSPTPAAPAWRDDRSAAPARADGMVSESASLHSGRARRWHPSTTRTKGQ